MGLLKPAKGGMYIDNVLINKDNYHHWQHSIAHVPQTIYLTDSSIIENIAFGVSPEKIDYSLVLEVAQQAQISDEIELFQDKYETLVGEQGVRLSGGQRQRIGIARALYKKADVIIFDEATSALDTNTEKSVMRAIKNINQDVTILIVAHRLTTLENCDFLIEVDKGKVGKKGSYVEIVDF